MCVINSTLAKSTVTILDMGLGDGACGGLIPVLWVCGPPGVGKSTVGWEFYTQLIDAGVQTGYVDIDQLGMCYPEPAADPGRYRLKAGNLGAVVANYQTAGASCVIASGVVDPAHGAHADLVPQAALTVCRLRADRDELRQRIDERGDQGYPLDEMLAEADALDESDFADLCVDTSGLSVAETTRLVRDRLAGWPSLPDPSRPAEGPPSDGEAAAGGRILLLCGPTGVGKSTIGWEVYVRTVRAGLIAAYLDVDQVGFCCQGSGSQELKARNLASIWQNYRAAGAQCLVAVGPIEDDAVAKAYAAALPDAAITLCRLHADAGELTRRIMLRGQGSGWNQPGDPLGGQPTEKLLEVAANAAAEAETLDQVLVDVPRIDTTRLTIEQAAGAIAAQSGWMA
ncbi:MAG TPA: hypothetical protein VFI65_34465 [Streptosporangiaceae bacterium]|nr:hypothetical protein [Streptosporangiaceae bacterium]